MSPSRATVDVAGVTGDRDGAPLGARHFFNRSVKVVTRMPVPNAITTAATAPITIAITEPAAAANRRRGRLGRL